jgi:hypothetical protein
LQPEMMAARRWARMITLYKSPSLSFISGLRLEVGKLRVLILQIRKEQKAYELGSSPSSTILMCLRVSGDT